MSFVYAVRRQDPNAIIADLIHIASTEEKARGWCDARLAKFIELGVQEEFGYPDELTWEGNRASIGFKRGYLTIETWELDGPIWNTGDDQGLRHDNPRD